MLLIIYIISKRLKNYYLFHFCGIIELLFRLIIIILLLLKLILTNISSFEIKSLREFWRKVSTHVSVIIIYLLIRPKGFVSLFFFFFLLYVYDTIYTHTEYIFRFNFKIKYFLLIIKKNYLFINMLY